MKASSFVAGALLPLVIAMGLLAGCQGEKSTDGADSGDGGAAAAASDGDPAAGADEGASADLDDVTGGADDAADEGAGAGEEPVETADSNVDAIADSGVNRFAPEAGMPREELSKYWTSMEIEIDGQAVGTMTFELWPEEAPVTVRNHLRLVDEGFYDGLTFHRIMRDFMIQGGDPTGTGTGNSPYGTIEAEFSRKPERSHEYGVLSMARTPAPNSASCQFFVICDNQNGRGLNGDYASFGRLTSGVETLETIAGVRVGRSPRGEPSVPQNRVVIKEATVHEGDPPRGETIQRPQ